MPLEIHRPEVEDAVDCRWSDWRPMPDTERRTRTSLMTWDTEDSSVALVTPGNSPDIGCSQLADTSSGFGQGTSHIVHF